MLPNTSGPLALHLVEEISHRVINEYCEAIAILSVGGSRGEASAAPVLELAAERLRAMADAHRSLLVPVAAEELDLGYYVRNLCASVSRASLRDRDIRLTVSTDDVPLDAARCWRVGLIVSELIRNAVRHGLKGRGGAIRVAVSACDGRVWCMVCDNGFAATNPPEGRGRKLIRALAEELGGSVEWKFGPAGTVVGLQFPREPGCSAEGYPVGQAN